MTTTNGHRNGGIGGEAAASASVREQRRLLDEMADADRSAWSWFPPIFVAAFTLLSFAGTYIGLRDIIATGDLRYGAMGDFLVMLLVLLATGAMVFFLRRAVLNFWSLGGFASFGAYLLLLFFSITFGFAFYWGRLEASGQAISGATQSLEQLSDEIQTSAFALRSTADDLKGLSTEFEQLAIKERTEGGTCGDGSGGGYGPRTRHRERRAEEIAARVSQIQPRFSAVTGPVAILEAELKKIEALSKPGGFSSADDFDLGGELGAAIGSQVEQTLGGDAQRAPAVADANGSGGAPELPEELRGALDELLKEDGAATGSADASSSASAASNSANAAAAPVAARAKPDLAFDQETLRRNPGAAREAQFRETRQAARRAAVEINALSADATLAAMAAEFRRWGEEYQNPALVRRDDPQGAPYKCIQFAAGARLLSAADRLENLPKVAAPDLPDYAGADATREAVFRMLDSAGYALSGGGALDALFSEETSALTPEGEAALRSSVGAAVRDASSAPAAAAAGSGGLKAQDRFPLAVAFIIDMLLFAFVLIERPGRKYFDRMKKRVNDAVKEEFDPLRMVALRQALEQDEDWQLLKEYRFDTDDRTFLVVPVVKNLPKPQPEGEEGAPRVEPTAETSFHGHDDLAVSVLRDVVMLWRRNRILRRAYFKPEALRENLLRAGRPDLASWDVLECYEFLPSGFEQLLLSGMTAGKRLERREERARRGQWGRSIRAALPGPSAPREERRRVEHRSDERGAEGEDARFHEPEAFEDEPYDQEPAPKRSWMDALKLGSSNRSADEDEPLELTDAEPLELTEDDMPEMRRRGGRGRRETRYDGSYDDTYDDDRRGDYQDADLDDEERRGLSFPWRR